MRVTTNEVAGAAQPEAAVEARQERRPPGRAVAGGAFLSVLEGGTTHVVAGTNVLLVRSRHPATTFARPSTSSHPKS